MALTAATAAAIPQHDTHTTIRTGEFNFVEKQEDRINLNKMEHTGHNDGRESSEFRSKIRSPRPHADTTAIFHPHDHQLSSKAR